ncbi:MAG: NADH-quinone oxidoreductase subunit L [Chloroflexi bacterium]|nr:NADH-quinone oxidoreductase subunit L [Chloroflexota bacterium]
MLLEPLLWLIPLPPLVAFFVILLFTRSHRRLSHTLAIGLLAVSWLLAMIVFAGAVCTEGLAEHPIRSSIPWLPTGSTVFSIGTLIDPLGAVTLFFVAWTLLAIFVYSVGYHNFGQPRGEHDTPGLPPHGALLKDGSGQEHSVPSVEPLYSRFFAFISLFAFGMLLLVVSDNLLTLFVGWEIMGLCSYLLIGFWFGKDSAKRAAVKAFLTTRVGDVFMLLGLSTLYAQTGTLSYRTLFSHEVLARLAETPSYIPGLSMAALAGLLLFMGTVGKSAQWPLHVWLPDAMEGPTPVSALIHAATMVSAGVYLIVRSFPLLTAGLEHGSSFTLSLIAFIGAFSALFAATIALAQNDIKRVLAYSTISQLGYMVAAVGIGAYVAAAFHLLTHAFFKALLFLGSGSVIHGVEHGVLHTGNHHVDAQDMFNMGGLRRRMPITFATFLIGGLALSGFPLITAGFWSKDEILADAFGHGHLVVFITLALSALLTAFYTARQITLTFLGEPRTEEARHAHESVWTMTAPLVLLSVFAIAAGWVGIPEHFPGLGGMVPNWFHEFVGSTLGEAPEAVAFSAVPLLISIGVALTGLGLGWLVYRRVPAGAPDPVARALGPVHTLLKNQYYFDELYDLTLVRPLRWFGETFVYQWVDRGLIDGILHGIGRLASALGSFFRRAIDLPIINGFGDLVGESTKRAGRSLRVLQTGRIQQYLLIGLINVVVVGALLFYLSALRP